MTVVKNEPSVQDERFDLDKILVEEIGEGSYQAKAIALCGLSALFFGLTINDFIFFAERIKTRCKIEECDDTLRSTFSPPWLANAVPAFGNSFDNCHRFASSNSWNVSTDNYTCPAALFDTSSIIECTEYVYQHENSAVYEFRLACDEWRWFLFGASQSLGMIISMSLTGIISDRWGRRFALAFASFNLAWISAARYWAQSYTSFILVGFLGSVFGSACMSCCLTLALEVVGSKRRMTASCILNTCTSIGSVVKGLTASTQPYWRDLILILYLPMMISISYFWIAPESVRWLISKQRFEESRTILIKAAKDNGKQLSDRTLDKLAECTRNTEARKSEANLTCLLFKYKSILFRCLIISMWSLFSSFMTKGLAIHSISISGNKYLNFCAVAITAIPGYWAATFIINRIGRKPLLTGLFWMSGLCQLGYIFIPNDSHWIKLVLYLLTKFCSAAVHSSVVVYTAELLPTSHRSRLSGFTATLGRVGGLIALFVPALADRVWSQSPHVLFSVTSLLSGFLVLLTPETLGTPLPETMEDAVQLGKIQRS